MTTRQEALDKLIEKIKDVRVAMLTTHDDESGVLRSRPMFTTEAETDGELWFFLWDDSPKAEEVEDEPQVNLSYAAPDKNIYVSVSGTAKVVHNMAKAEDLWNPALKAWFPDGLADPHLGLLRVRIDQAEYWDAPSNRMVQLAGMLKAIATGTTYEPGENEKLTVS